MGQKCLENLENACRGLEECEEQLLQQEKRSIAELHVKETQRYPMHLLLRWEVLTKESGYDLETLRKKAPEQSLIFQLDIWLDKKLSRRGVRLPEMTRYRVITTLCRAGGLDGIQPFAIKQFFLRTARK